MSPGGREGVRIIGCELEAVAGSDCYGDPAPWVHIRSVLVYCIHRQSLEDTSYTALSERPFKRGPTIAIPIETAYPRAKLLPNSVRRTHPATLQRGRSFQRPVR